MYVSKEMDEENIWGRGGKMKEKWGIFIAISLILILGFIPIVIVICWSGAEAPIDNKYDDTEIKEQLASLKTEMDNMEIEMNRIIMYTNESFSSLNNQISNIKIDFDKIWDSYDSLFDYVMRLEATQ